MLGSTRVAAQLAASQEGLSSMSECVCVYDRDSLVSKVTTCVRSGLEVR
jgi:hypothetical protein